MAKKKSQKGKKENEGQDYTATSNAESEMNGSAHDSDLTTTSTSNGDIEHANPPGQEAPVETQANDTVEPRQRGLSFPEESPSYQSLLHQQQQETIKFDEGAFEPLPEQSGARTPLLDDHSIEEFLLEIPSSSRYTDAPVPHRSQKRNSAEKEQDGRCGVKIEWSSSAREVCVAFDSDWSVQHRMRRLPSGTFEYSTRLPPFQIVQFKFVVDGNWRKSQDFPSMTTQGSVANNYVVPILLEWAGAARNVFASFLHESPTGKVDDAPKHKLRYQRERWVLETHLDRVGDYRFIFVVDGQKQLSSKYATEDSLNIIHMTLPATHRKNSYSGSSDPAIDDEHNTEPVEPTEHTEHTVTQPQQTTNDSSLEKSEKSPVPAPAPAPAPAEPAPEPIPPKSDPKPDETNKSEKEQAIVLEPERRAEEGDSESEHSTWLESTTEVSIYWTGPDAKHVELRFDYDGWEKSHHATRLESGVFRFTGRFPSQKILQFKFIVDGEWRTSEEYFPFVDSNGNRNNFVVPVRLEWTEGGSDVWARSSCDKWAVTHPAKWENGRWVLHLTVPHTGKHEFKFVVDGTWRLASNHPATDDGTGNTNNYFNC